MSNIENKLAALDFCFEDIKNAIGSMIDGETDFHLDTDGGEFRFIEESQILPIAIDEIGSDEYILGCFNDSFIADATDIPFEVIRKLQSSECFEALGLLIKSGGHLATWVEDYIDTDGAGHHFAHYDHDETVLEYDGVTYSVFRTN